jgi:phage protein D
VAGGRVGSFRAVNDEFRVEVELDDDEHGYSLGERLRAFDLDDEARERLGGRVLVTRDGSRLFLYAASEAQAREAAEVVRSLVDADELTAEISVTRWHPVERAWKDASIPLPRTPEEEEAEYAAREAAEAEEAAIEGEYDWQVVIHLPGRDEAIEFADRLRGEGVPVSRRWRYVRAGALTEERAEELAERLRGELPNDVEVSVEANLSDVRLPAFQFLTF